MIRELHLSNQCLTLWHYEDDAQITTHSPANAR